MKDELGKLLYADDLAIVYDKKREPQEAMEQWRELFKAHGLKMSLAKMRVLWIARQREETNIELDRMHCGKEIVCFTLAELCVGKTGLR